MRIHWLLVAIGLFFSWDSYLGAETILLKNENAHSSSISKETSKIKHRGLGGMKTSEGIKRIDYSKRAAEIHITCLRNEKEVILKDGDSISQKDLYAISFNTTLDRYVYLFQIDSRGNMTQIFPNSQIATISNPINPGKVYRLPSEKDWFYLDENKGTEQVFLISQMVPIKKPALIVDRMVNAKTIKAAVRSVGGVRQRSPALRNEILTIRRYFRHE